MWIAVGEVEKQEGQRYVVASRPPPSRGSQCPVGVPHGLPVALRTSSRHSESTASPRRCLLLRRSGRTCGLLARETHLGFPEGKLRPGIGEKPLRLDHCNGFKKSA